MNGTVCPDCRSNNYQNSLKFKTLTTEKERKKFLEQFNPCCISQIMTVIYPHNLTLSYIDNLKN
jgi:hypothetical protein